MVTNVRHKLKCSATEACKPIELNRTEQHKCLVEKWHPGDLGDFTIICRWLRFFKYA